MLQKPILFLTVMGVTIGLLIGILDSSLHFFNFENYKIVNIAFFILFFTGIYWSVIFFRQKIKSGTITYGSAYRNFLFVGFIASLIIALARFTFLQYIFIIDIDYLLNETNQSLIDNYSYYTDVQIYNRLSFIEFIYNPIVSSVMYFVYYSIFVIIFAFVASFFISRNNKNLSL